MGFLKVLLRILIWIIQIPLTVIYFVFGLIGSISTGLGWWLGGIIYTITIILCVFRQFNSTKEIIIAFAVATALSFLPRFITEFVCDKILKVKEFLDGLG
jgi:hypothetical protein